MAFIVQYELVVIPAPCVTKGRRKEEIEEENENFCIAFFCLFVEGSRQEKIGRKRDGRLWDQIASESRGA